MLTYILPNQEACEKMPKQKMQSALFVAFNTKNGLFQIVKDRLGLNDSRITIVSGKRLTEILNSNVYSALYK